MSKTFQGGMPPDPPRKQGPLATWDFSPKQYILDRTLQILEGLLFRILQVFKLI